MSLFGKRPESQPVALSQSDELVAPTRSYGVADLIRLLKTIPLDQHPDLLVRVVRTTLESVGVQSAQVIDDAQRQESAINARISALESEIEGLSSEIHLRREQIAQLRVELSETTYARERLQGSEGGALSAPSPESFHSAKSRSLPPPLPPPLHKASSGKPPEPPSGN
jgi:hypothetical protein